MSDLVLSNITSGYNLSLINSNFQAIQDKINNFCLQTSQGDNVMSQDLDMNSYSILNMVTNFSNNGSMLTVGDAKSHFYQIGLVPTTTNSGDAINYGQVSQMIEAASVGTDPVNVALYDVLASNLNGEGASLIGIQDNAGLFTSTTVEGALAESAASVSDIVAGLGNKSGFLQSGTGAVLESYLDKAREIVSIKDFGGVGDGVTDNTAAFNAAFTYLLSVGGGCLKVPAGKWKILSKITVTMSGLKSLSMVGEGIDVTKIFASTPTGDAFEFIRGAGNWWIDVAGGNQNGVYFKEFALMTDKLNVGTGIKITGGSTVGRPPAPIRFTNIQIRANANINTEAFLVGVHLYNCGGASFDGCSFVAGGTSNLTPTQVKIECDTTNMDFSGIQFTRCGFTYGNYGIVAGDRIEGLYLTDCAFVGMNVGISWVANSESGLQVTGCHFNTINENMILTGVYDYCLQGNLFYGPSSGTSTNSIVHSGGGRVTITGNTFYGRCTTPIGIGISNVAGGTQAGITIEGNQFTNFDRAISLASTANSVTVGTNGYSSVTTFVYNSSTSSYVMPRIYATTTVKSLTGGASSEYVDLPVPAGVLSSKAQNAIMQVTDPLGTDMIGFYAYNEASNTSTNVRFRVVRRDGATLPAGSFRFGFTVFGV